MLNSFCDQTLPIYLMSIAKCRPIYFSLDHTSTSNCTKGKNSTKIVWRYENCITLWHITTIQNKNTGDRSFSYIAPKSVVKRLTEPKPTVKSQNRFSIWKRILGFSSRWRRNIVENFTNMGKTDNDQHQIDKKKKLFSHIFKEIGLLWYYETLVWLKKTNTLVFNSFIHIRWKMWLTIGYRLTENRPDLERG